MKLRKNVFPNNLADWCSFIFIIIIIPVFYWFELFIVLPEFYVFTSTWYWFHFIFATFVMKNVISNFLAVTFIDTSIFSANIPVDKFYNGNYCTYCQLPIPLRCWHCDICKRCILKRDHHCTFSGCCIGHFNQRFFFMFLSYLFIGCCYALYLNVFFIMNHIDLNLNIIFQIVFPFMILLLGIDKSGNHCIIIILLLNIVGLVITGILLKFHLRLICRGSVTYEDNRDIDRYNLGFKYNLINTLGTRWYLTWLSPFINSTIILDGIDWDIDTISHKIKKI